MDGSILVAGCNYASEENTLRASMLTTHLNF